MSLSPSPLLLICCTPGTIEAQCRTYFRSVCDFSPLQKKRLKRLVYLPLCNLTETLKGPQSLIRKRLDKLLDYEELEDKRNETGSVTYEEEAAMNTYLAINSLLVSELPVFNLIALKWLKQILHSFVVLQRDLAKQVLQDAEGEIAQVKGARCRSRQSRSG